MTDFRIVKLIDSLSSLCIHKIVNNLSKFNDDYLDRLSELPEHLRNSMLHLFTISMHYGRNVDFNKVLSSFLHKNTERVDLTANTFGINDEVLKLIEQCVHLRRLYLEHNAKYTGEHFSTHGLLNLIPHLKHVNLIVLANCECVDDDVIECIAMHCTELQLLDVGGCSNITDRSMESLANLTKLRSLSLNRTQVSDKGMECLLNGNFGGILIDLQVANCPNISERILRPISETCKRLELLNFYNCKVEDTSAFTYLEHVKQLHWTIQCTD